MIIETYLFNDGQLIITDPELGISFYEEYAPILVPGKRKDGKKLSEAHLLRVIHREGHPIEECYVEKEGKKDGQFILLYPSGKKKTESYYVDDKLHGPSTFYQEDGKVLAKSWYIYGKKQGKSFWYYPSGSLYSIQRFLNGLWHGQQDYFFDNGNQKTLMTYHHGKLEGKVLLYSSNGNLERELEYSEGIRK